MKITLSNHPLAAGLQQGEPPLDLKVAAQKLMQLSTTVRSAFIKAYDRGNLKTRVSFCVKRTHPSAEAALYFSIKHAADLQDARGTTTFTLEDAINESDFFLYNSVLERIDSVPVGNETESLYIIVGGEIST